MLGAYQCFVWFRVSLNEVGDGDNREFGQQSDLLRHVAREVDAEYERLAIVGEQWVWFES